MAGVLVALVAGLAGYAVPALADGPFSYSDRFCDRLVGANSTDTCAGRNNHHYAEVFAYYQGSGSVSRCAGAYVTGSSTGYVFRGCGSGSTVAGCYTASCGPHTSGPLLTEYVQNRSPNNHTLTGEGYA